MIYFRALNYLDYLFFRGQRNGHGIHSPFVFDLVSRVFRNKINPGVVCSVENIRRKMISDKRVLEIRDLGSGSVKNEISLRKVKDIARYSPVPKKYGFLLARMAAAFGEGYIVELGTSVGISTMYMAGARPDSTIYTIEGSPAICDVAAENFSEAGFTNIRLLRGSFEELLPPLLDLPGTPGLIFIDGNHRKDAVINYFRQVSKKSGNATVIIFDDIRYSKEMEEAWDVIKKDERVSFTVDTWRMGMVFFREGVTPGNYKVRY